MKFWITRFIIGSEWSSSALFQSERPAVAISELSSDIVLWCCFFIKRPSYDITLVQTWGAGQGQWAGCPRERVVADLRGRGSTQLPLFLFGNWQGCKIFFVFVYLDWHTTKYKSRWYHLLDDHMCIFVCCKIFLCISSLSDWTVGRGLKTKSWNIKT